MTRGRLAVHAHFYQPLRADPFGGPIPPDPSAAPYPDWNARIAAECYRPIAERGTLARLSFDVGPTLAEWMAEHEPALWARFAAADRTPDRAGGGAMTAGGGAMTAAGGAMAQGFHHSILPLATAADRLTEIRWGVREFELRFGRRPVGFWLPETAADRATLRDLAAEGIRHTILAPWQVDDAGLDTRRPVRIDLDGRQTMAAAIFDRDLSAAVSFDFTATADADAFARERVAPRLAEPPIAGGAPGLVLIATDGELYGHHRVFADLFLARLLDPGPGFDRGFDVVRLAAALEEASARPLPTVGLVEGTSWSCHHGLLRWSGECGCTPDGGWKAPLRAALARLARGVDSAIADACLALPGHPDPNATRDAYVDVVVGAETGDAFAAQRLGTAADADDRPVLLELMEAARWRLAMFASDGWFWAGPDRPETRHVLLCAARSARLVDRRTGSRLESRFVHDLALVHAPDSGPDLETLYRRALADVGQPLPT